MPPLSAMLAIQSNAGLVFGQMVQWKRREVVFELALALDRGADLEFRVEMVGLDDTVLGKLRVLERRPPVDGVTQHAAEIHWVHPEDLRIYDDWAAAFEAGRAPSSLRALDNQSGFRSGGVRGTSAEERARVSGEMEARLRQRQERAREVLSAAKKVWPDPFDAVGGRVAAAMAFVAGLEPNGHGPAPSLRPARTVAPVAMPDAAPAAVTPTPVGAPRVPPVVPAVAAPTPVVPAVAASTPVVAPRPAAMPPAAAVPSRPAPVAPPVDVAPPEAPDHGSPPFSVRVDRTRPIPRVVFRWTDIELLRDDVRAHLKHRVMHLPNEDVGPVGARVDVVLDTPVGFEVICMGRVALVTPQFTGIQLMLAPWTRTLLAHV